MGFRYRNIPEKKTSEGRTYKTNVIYPEIPLHPDDTYVITTGGDRYDILALQFYNDSSLWWIIVSANNSQKASLTIPTGTQLRIPADKDAAISLFSKVNRTR